MNQLEHPVELIIRACRDYLPLISEYYTLAVLPRLNETQIQQMEDIFKKAEQDPLLNFLIDETDHLIGHELGLISTEFVQTQQEQLKQTIDKMWVRLALTQIDSEPQTLAERLKQAQMMLKNQGFYNGPIDGEYTVQTQAAFQNLKHQLYQAWEQLEGHSSSERESRCEDLLRSFLSNRRDDDEVDPSAYDLLSLELWTACCIDPVC